MPFHRHRTIPILVCGRVIISPQILKNDSISSILYHRIPGKRATVAGEDAKARRGVTDPEESAKARDARREMALIILYTCDQHYYDNRLSPKWDKSFIKVYL